MGSRRRQQQGVALITAILLVAIATTLAAKIAWDNQLNVRRTESTLNIEQARQFALGAEAVAIYALTEHLRLVGPYDSPLYWDEYNVLLPLELSGEVIGQMQGQLFDAHSKFNVNNLVSATGNAGVDADVRQQFQALFNLPAFRNADVDPAIIDTMTDWIDNDTVPQSIGAEDDAYTSLTPPYRAANNYLLDSSELRGILGVDAATFALLDQYLTALPPGWCGSGTGGITPVNINFIGDAALLAALMDMPLGDAETILAARPVAANGKVEGWQSTNEVNWNNTDVAARAETYTTVQSSCAFLRVNVIIGRQTLTMYSLLDRSGNNGSIITRVRAFGLD
jgi:general secretion pathway protein K